MGCVRARARRNGAPRWLSVAQPKLTKWAANADTAVGQSQEMWRKNLIKCQPIWLPLATFLDRKSVV